MHLAALFVATSITLGSGVDFLVFHLKLAVLDQVIHLEDLVARLGLQLHIVVSNLIQITVTTTSIKLGRDELVGIDALVSRRLPQAASVIDHHLAGAGDLTWVRALQVESVDGVGHLWGSLGRAIS